MYLMYVCLHFDHHLEVEKKNTNNNKRVSNASSVPNRFELIQIINRHDSLLNVIFYLTFYVQMQSLKKFAPCICTIKTSLRLFFLLN